MKSFKQFILEKMTRPESNKPVTKNDLVNVEHFLNSMYEKIGVELDIHSAHFLYRVNDVRNGKQVSTREIRSLFEKIFRTHKDKLVKLVGENKPHEIVLQDLSSLLNIPVILDIHPSWMHEKPELEAKTIMRTDQFRSRGEVIKV